VSAPTAATTTSNDPTTKVIAGTPNRATAAVSSAAPIGPGRKWIVQNAEVTRPNSSSGVTCCRSDIEHVPATPWQNT
jgi:hypothetical protein